MCLHAGVTITNDPLPFTVGQNAVLTCSSDSGVVDHIQWMSRDDVVLASITPVQQLQFMLRPVNDSLFVHTASFTCSVTRDEGRLNQTISNQTLPVTVKSRCLLTHMLTNTLTHICRKHTVYYPHICLIHTSTILVADSDVHLQCSYTTTILTQAPQHAHTPPQHALTLPPLHALTHHHSMHPHHHSMHSHTTTACTLTPPQHARTPPQHALTPPQHALTPPQHALTHHHSMHPHHHSMHSHTTTACTLTPPQHARTPPQHALTPPQHALSHHHSMHAHHHSMHSHHQGMHSHTTTTAWTNALPQHALAQHALTHYHSMHSHTTMACTHTHHHSMHSHTTTAYTRALPQHGLTHYHSMD